MKHALPFALSFVALTGLSSAQQCDLIDQDFESIPLTAPVTSIPGWTAIAGTTPTVDFNLSGSRSLALNTAGFAGTTGASRSLPATLFGEYQIEMDVESAGGSASVSLDCTVGVASRVTVSGGVGSYIVTSINGASMNVAAPSVSVRYEVDDDLGYTLFIDGVFFEQMPWPAALCDTRPSITFSAPLTFGGGVVYFDNLCMSSSLNNIGTNYCTALPHSGMVAAVISATGSTVASDNAVTLRMENMPTNEFGFFLASLNAAATPTLVPGAGNLCLDGGQTIARLNQANLIMNSGAAGRIAVPIDMTQIPLGSQIVAIQAGETWYFQGWFRDGANGSNFSDGLEVNFN